MANINQMIESKYLKQSDVVEQEKPKPAARRGPAALDGMGDDIPFSPIGKGISGHAR